MQHFAHCFSSHRQQKPLSENRVLGFGPGTSSAAGASVGQVGLCFFTALRMSCNSGLKPEMIAIN